MNYIIPRELVDYRTSYELIEETFYQYISQTLGTNGRKNLEIEAKIGYIMEGENQAFNDFKNILYSLSDRDFFVVGLMSPTRRLTEYFQSDLISPHYRFFKEPLSSQTFSEIKEYMHEESIKNPQKIKEMPEEFTLDFILKDGERVTYRFADNSCKKMKKVERTNIDIVHKGNPFRLSFSFEEE